MAHAARLSASAGVAGARAWITPHAPVPFEDLLVEQVEHANGLLGVAAGGALDLLSHDARTILCRALLVRLSDIALATFASEFALYRALHQPLPGVVPIRADHAYRRFAAAGQAGVMAHYPTLARLLRCACRNWAESHGEMLVRLRADWDEVRAMIDSADTDPRVSRLLPYCSDPHHDGRAVTLLVLGCGAVLVYKPRSVAMECRLDALLGWANARGYSHAFRRPALIERPGYGWMAHVAAAPCRTGAELGAYYHRIGGLIALVTLFQGTDIHQENLVAAGEHPVIVDAETLVHPRIDPAIANALGPGAARHPAANDFAAALDDCGFLPRAYPVPAGQPDFSALGAAGPVDTPFPHPICTGVNSDAMAVVQAPYRAPGRANIPTLDGVPRPVTHHVDQVLAGYAELVALALDHRASLLGIVRRFAGCPVRVVVRSTNSYGLLLNASLAPVMLRDDGARAGLLARLSTAAAGPHASACADILGEERRALLRLDVPHLTRPCDVAAPGWRAPLAEVERRIAMLDTADRADNLALLRARLERMPGAEPAAAHGEQLARGDRS